MRRSSLGLPLATFALAFTVTTTLAGSALAEPIGADKPATTPSDDAGWAARQRALDESFTRTGGSGLLRLENATGAAPGQIRIGLVTEAFSASFLCSAQYPCRNPRGGAAIIADSGTGHAGATLAIGAGLAKLGPGVLEAYLSSGAFTTSDSANAPSLLPSLGDTTLGARYGAPLTRALSVGGTLEARVSGAGGDVGPDLGSTSGRLGAVLSGDLRPLGAPIRTGLNLAYELDNGAHSLAATETARGTSVTRIERFAMSANRVDHVDMRIGAEALLVRERVRPFVEYGLLIPVDRQGYLCRQSNASSDGCLATSPVIPSSLTIGGRFLPWKHGLSLLLALDIGVTGTSSFIEEIAPTPPWMLHAGVGWAFDLQDAPPVVREVKVEAPAAAPKLARVRGLVHDAAGAPIANARLRYAGHPELFALATGDTGEFGAELAPGEYALSIDADGYASGTCKVVVGAAPASALAPAPASASALAPAPASALAPVSALAPDSKVDCVLAAAPKSGTLVFTVRDVASGAVVKDVRVQLAFGANASLEGVSDAAGAVRFEGMTAGPVKVVVTAEHYLVFAGQTEVSPHQTTRVEWTLEPRPEKAGVTVAAGKLKTSRPIEFETDGITIRPTSYPVLAEVADTLVRRPELRHVEVQAHTDVAGGSEQGRTRTQGQADTIRAWLVGRGVAEDRLAARGFGAERPLVPNVTSTNRAKNRRVDIAVLDSGDSAGAAGPTSHLRNVP